MNFIRLFSTILATSPKPTKFFISFVFYITVGNTYKNFENCSISTIIAEVAHSILCSFVVLVVLPLLLGRLLHADFDGL